jgi:uncharacterized protein YrrD
MTPSLARATELVGKPVVSASTGDVLADVKDVIYSAGEGRLLGFSLNKRGFLAGPAKDVLPWAQVSAVGRDAVMVDGPESLVGPKDARPEVGSPAPNRNVIGNAVMSDAGQELGKVTDLVVDTDHGDVIGYELGGSVVEGLRGGRHLLIPLPEQLSVSGTTLMVPAAVQEFVRDDLSGFGSAVEEFRARLREGHADAPQ